MTAMKKKQTDLSRFTKEELEEAKKENRKEWRAGLVLLYFVAAFALTAYATDKHALTYAQISFVYLPMFFIFIYWLIQRMNNADNAHSRFGSIVGIGMCVFVIVATLAVTFRAYFGA